MGPWAELWAGCGVLHDLSQHQIAEEVIGVEEDARAWAPPTAAEDHLAVVAAGRADHRAAVQGRRKQALAVVVEHMEAVAAAACKCVGHSWDGNFVEAAKAGQGVEAGRDRATVGVVDSPLVQVVGVEREDTGLGAGGRMAVVPAEGAVEGSHKGPVSDSRVWHQSAGDLLCPYQHVHHGLLHSGTTGIESNRSQAEPGEGRVVEDRNYTPCRRVVGGSRFDCCDDRLDVYSLKESLEFSPLVMIF